MTQKLTPVEQEAFDLMKPGVWYCGEGLYGESLPFTIRRRAHVLDCLKNKGWVEWKVRLSIPGNYRSTYSVYRKPVSSPAPGVTETQGKLTV
jgi:hypothetical protein